MFHSIFLRQLKRYVRHVYKKMLINFSQYMTENVPTQFVFLGVLSLFAAKYREEKTGYEITMFETYN